MQRKIRLAGAEKIYDDCRNARFLFDYVYRSVGVLADAVIRKIADRQHSHFSFVCVRFGKRRHFLRANGGGKRNGGGVGGVARYNAVFFHHALLPNAA